MAAAGGVLDSNEKAHRERLARNLRNWLTNGDGQLALREMVGNDSDRLHMDLTDLEFVCDKPRSAILSSPALYLPALEEALFELRVADDPHFKKQAKARRPCIALHGTFGRFHVTPRGLTAGYLGKMVCIDGIVTRCTNVGSKLVCGVYFNKTTGAVVAREQIDRLALVTNLESESGPPKNAEQGEYEQEVGLSVYKDTQKITLQEMPERAPTGLLPRSVDVILEGDLVNSTKPGERVRVSAYLKPFPKQEGGLTSGLCKSVSIANRVERLSKEVRGLELDPNDIKNIKKIGARDDVFELCGRSFAPSICGHKLVKQGMVLMLLGGVEKVLENKTHLRGDINLLLMGDPSCGKSQLLRFVMNIAPLAISTTGRGSSGVGLTAAVVRDSQTREQRLEAGALVLGDRGVVCIDEFDKMTPADRTAIHEVMEQQTVTIAKGGLHAQLNARCSVVAAANPIYGSYDESVDLAKNINLPDSLLSRFDLIFMVRDLTEEEEDRKIAKQVIRQLRHRDGNGIGSAPKEGLRDPTIEPEKKVLEDDEPTEIFQKEALFNGEEVLTVEFLRKYLHYAKQRIKPDLTSDSIDQLAEFYRDLRQRQAANPKTTVVTTRTLEAAIRLSTAHAKLRLSNEVQDKDVNWAKYLILQSRGEETDGPPNAAAASESPPPPPAPGAGPAAAAAAPAGGVAKYSDFMEAMANVAATGQYANGVKISDLTALVNEKRKPGAPAFTEETVRSHLDVAQQDDKLAIIDDEVHFM